MKNEYTRHTLSVLVENSSGVLSQVSRLFSRKGYNIESLAVGTTDDPAESRITIEVMGDSAMMEQLMNQLRKLFPVHGNAEHKIYMVFCTYLVKLCQSRGNILALQSGKL